jgi:hypothetical protein
MPKLAFCLAALLVLLVNASGQNTSSPTIVAKIQLLNQTGVVSPTTIFTPSTTGMYRVSTVIVLTQANGTTDSNAYYWGQLSFNYVRTPGQADATYPLYVTKLSASSGVTVVMSSAGQPISFFTTSGGGDITNTKYNVYIEVEKL